MDRDIAKAGDRLASMLDFLEVADSAQRRADRSDQILMQVAKALYPVYGDDVWRCTTETWPKWVAELVERVKRAEAQGDRPSDPMQEWHD